MSTFKQLPRKASNLPPTPPDVAASLFLSVKNPPAFDMNSRAGHKIVNIITRYRYKLLASNNRDLECNDVTTNE